MPEIPTGYGCPICRQTGARSEIVASERRLVCRVNPNHQWVDTMEFQKLRPTLEFAIAPAAPAPQQGHTKWALNVSLPPTHRQAVEAKLGPNLEVTIAGILSMMAEGDVMLIPSGDLQRMKQIPSIGKIPQSAGELVGMIYAADLQKQEAVDNERRAQEEVQAYEGRNRQLLVIDLGEHRQYADAKAKDENMPTKTWVEMQMKNAIANNWF